MPFGCVLVRVKLSQIILAAVLYQEQTKNTNDYVRSQNRQLQLHTTALSVNERRHLLHATLAGGIGIVFWSPIGFDVGRTERDLALIGGGCRMPRLLMGIPPRPSIL